jgi:hypothetical protein
VGCCDAQGRTLLHREDKALQRDQDAGLDGSSAGCWRWWNGDKDKVPEERIELICPSLGQITDPISSLSALTRTEPWTPSALLSGSRFALEGLTHQRVPPPFRVGLFVRPAPGFFDLDGVAEPFFLVFVFIKKL